MVLKPAGVVEATRKQQLVVDTSKAATDQGAAATGIDRLKKEWMPPIPAATQNVLFPDARQATGAAPMLNLLKGNAGVQASAGPKAGASYTVRSGDSLSKIAKRIYGDASMWTVIYEANKGVIGDNPNLIKPNQELKLPAPYEIEGDASDLAELSQAALEEKYGPQMGEIFSRVESGKWLSEVALLQALNSDLSEEELAKLIAELDPSAEAQQLARAVHAFAQRLKANDLAGALAERRKVHQALQAFSLKGTQGQQKDLTSRLLRERYGVYDQNKRPVIPFKADAKWQNYDESKAAPVECYPPFAQKTVELFRQACRLKGLPEEWATDPALHELLAKENGSGRVGQPNYTYGENLSPQQIAAIHADLKRGRIRTRSSATGLGQLLLSNADQYYPSGRAGIGNPLEEAAGMLAYIADRYGTPKKANWLHGRYAPEHGKKFKEGY